MSFDSSIIYKSKLKNNVLMVFEYFHSLYRSTQPYIYGLVRFIALLNFNFIVPTFLQHGNDAVLSAY